MNASSILRSAFVALTFAAIGVSESSAQLPSLYSAYPTTYAATYPTTYPAAYPQATVNYYPAVPAATYGNVYGNQWNTGYLNSGLYNTPQYGNQIGVGGCYGGSSVGNSAYWPSAPYGTASNDYNWNNGGFSRPGSQWNNGWNSWSQNGNSNDWSRNNGHQHFDRDRDYRFNQFGSSNQFRSR